MFTEHTVESAPAAARRSMAATTSHLGYLPSAVALMATSPDLLDGFLKLSAMFEGTTLDPIAREVVIMTIATRNGCHLCVAMHTARLTALDADAALIAALREGAARRTRAWTRSGCSRCGCSTPSGDVGDAALRAFLAQGYTEQNALEVVLGIGAYTMGTLANR